MCRVLIRCDTFSLPLFLFNLLHQSHALSLGFFLSFFFFLSFPPSLLPASHCSRALASLSSRLSARVNVAKVSQRG